MAKRLRCHIFVSVLANNIVVVGCSIIGDRLKFMRKIIVLILAVSALAASAADYEALCVKADRFFEQKEWPSAAAMLDLMLDKHPDVAATYGRAIVVAALCGDTVAEMELMNRSIINYVPFDSTFAAVRSVSFSLGKTNLYEDFLLRTKVSEPWLGRTVDAYLMRYYTFRRNPVKMIEYSHLMLKGMPDNVEFLSTLARGLMLDGNAEEAVDTYRRILEIDPGNYDALLEIGNYNYLCWRDNNDDLDALSRARAALSQAQSIRATPYVSVTLDDINRAIQNFANKHK